MSKLQLVQQLKQQIHCSSPMALQLLKEANNDLNKAEQFFHEKNIAFIQQQANSDRILAEKCYHLCEYNIEKAIKRTKDWIFYERITQCIITTFDNKNSHDYPACFILTAIDKDNKKIMDLETIEQTFTIIPIEDVWDYLYNKDINVFDFDKYFAPYFENCLSLEQVDKLIKNLENITNNNPKVMTFYQELANWLTNCKKIAHSLAIFGNN